MLARILFYVMLPYARDVSGTRPGKCTSQRNENGRIATFAACVRCFSVCTVSLCTVNGRCDEDENVWRDVSNNALSCFVLVPLLDSQPIGMNQDIAAVSSTYE